MNGHTSEAWRYFRNEDGNFSVYPAGCDENPSLPRVIIAEIFAEHFEDAEANARLIAGAPEMRIALIAAVEALRATEIFMRGVSDDTDELNKIIDVIDELLDRIDGTEA